MNSIMNENVFVKEYECGKPLMHRKDSIIDICNRDCHHKIFHTFEYKCVYDIQLTIISNNELVNLVVADKSMNL